MDVLAALLLAAIDLRLDYVRHSLTATYRHYTQYVEGVPVLGGEVIERDGLEVYRALARDPHPPFGHLSEAKDRVRVNINGEARPARRVIVRERPHEPVARYVDDTGAILKEIPLFFNVKGRVFEVNPVAKLNAPQLRDQNDIAAAVPEAAYAEVELPELAPSGTLSGPNVKIVDPQTPNTPRADASQSLLFDRSRPEFEEVNVYYNIDRTQRYLQSLGYAGPRRLVGYPIAVDPHALGGSDNSVYESSSVVGQGVLFFGDGGVDDAEDSDIVLHEYTHAIQDWIAPGAFFGSSASESRALAEGIADYWAFSQTYVQTLASGRDPYCIGDWDARCEGDDPTQECGYPPGADCLRRVDSAKTMADFRAVERPGQEHDNGAIWSSALREIFEGLIARHPATGRQLSDQIVIESMFGIPSNPTFALLARQTVAAARALSPNDRDVVCAAMNRRGIVVADCDPAPHGEWTLFQSSRQSIVITDVRAVERLAVQADVAGSDAHLVLIGPDGARVALPANDAFRGRSAAGTWTLEVTGGTLRSWSLLIQFAGDQLLAARPFSFAPRKHIPVVAHAEGVGGTSWVSDVRIFNRGSKAANVMAVYTPDAGGFAAVKLVIAPKQILALNDVVRSPMQSPNGLGSLELQGDVADLVVTSRTYTADARGTFGQFIPGADTSDAVGGLTHGYVIHLRNSADFRSNVGFTEVAGEAGVVRVSDRDIAVAPFQHWQMPATGSGELVADFSVVSGAARILAYGSAIDNKSGDAIYIPAHVAPASSRTEYAPAISATGALGTRWSTEVVVRQLADSIAPIGALFGGASATITPPARFANILTELFHRDETMGLLRVDFPPGAIAMARISTPSDGGSYGQFVPFTAEGHGGDLIQLESSDAFRTNVGAANIGTAPVKVRFTAFDDSGVELGTTERVLRPSELVQFPLRSLVAHDVANARVRVEGNVLAYASMVDNRSGDAIYVPAR
ncbi:MAG: M36 family metallopeptidase [Acidobacteriota bacterium]